MIGTMKISSVDRRSITGQAIVNGRLVTEFRRSLFSDGTECHPAGTLVCDQPTEQDKERYKQLEREFYSDDYPTHDWLMSDTVTRFGILFWDEGRFTPRT